MEDSAIGFGNLGQDAVLLDGRKDAGLVLRSLRHWRSRDLSNLAAPVQPCEESPKGCNHIPAGLRLQAFLPGPQREVLKRSIRDFVDAGLHEESEITA